MSLPGLGARWLRSATCSLATPSALTRPPPAPAADRPRPPRRPAGRRAGKPRLDRLELVRCSLEPLGHLRSSAGGGETLRGLAERFRRSRNRLARRGERRVRHRAVFRRRRQRRLHVDGAREERPERAPRVGPRPLHVGHRLPDAPERELRRGPLDALPRSGALGSLGALERLDRSAVLLRHRPLHLLVDLRDHRRELPRRLLRLPTVLGRLLRADGGASVELLEGERNEVALLRKPRDLALGGLDLRRLAIHLRQGQRGLPIRPVRATLDPDGLLHDRQTLVGRRIQGPGARGALLLTQRLCLRAMRLRLLAQRGKLLLERRPRRLRLAEFLLARRVVRAQSLTLGGRIERDKRVRERKLPLSPIEDRLRREHRVHGLPRQRGSPVEVQLPLALLHDRDEPLRRRLLRRQARRRDRLHLAQHLGVHSRARPVRRRVRPADVQRRQVAPRLRKCRVRRRPAVVATPNRRRERERHRGEPSPRPPRPVRGMDRQRRVVLNHARHRLARGREGVESSTGHHPHAGPFGSDATGRAPRRPRAWPPARPTAACTRPDSPVAADASPGSTRPPA